MTYLKRLIALTLTAIFSAYFGLLMMIPVFIFGGVGDLSYEIWGIISVGIFILILKYEKKSY